MSEEAKRILELVASGKISPAEAESLLGALEASQRRHGAGEGPACCGGEDPDGCAESGGSTCCAAAPTAAGATPQYLCVKLDNADGHVNVRVPLRLLRAGLQLHSLLPATAREKITAQLGAHGIDPQGKKAENLIAQLCRCEINTTTQNGESVHLCCR